MVAAPTPQPQRSRVFDPPGTLRTNSNTSSNRTTQHATSGPRGASTTLAEFLEGIVDAGRGPPLALPSHMHHSTSRPTMANRAPPATGQARGHAGSGSTVQVEAHDLGREPLIGSKEDRSRVTGARRGNGTWAHVVDRPASSAAPSRHPPPRGTVAVPTPQQTTCNHTTRTMITYTPART